MTHEEIKKIAVSYSVSRPADEMPTNPAMAQMIVSDALKWLSKDYCIVPKSKVIGLWNEINNDAKANIENGFPDYAEFNKLQLPPLEILFGKDMFEEEGK